MFGYIVAFSSVRVHTKYSTPVFLATATLTAISRHADIEIPVPSISFSAYSLPSLTSNTSTITTKPHQIKKCTFPDNSKLHYSDRIQNKTKLEKMICFETTVII